MGIGLGFQVPMMVAQGVSLPTDLSSVTAIMLFFQCITGAVYLSISQSLFANRLLQSLPQFVPGLDPAEVLATGATELRQTFTSVQLPAILQAYMLGLRDAFTLGIPIASLAFCVAVAMLVFDYKNLHGPGETQKDALAVEKREEFEGA